MLRRDPGLNSGGRVPSEGVEIDEHGSGDPMGNDQRFDVVIKDGMVFDGTGAPRVRADVGIRDGRGHRDRTGRRPTTPAR